jgi:signal transduction histidine kinase
VPDGLSPAVSSGLYRVAQESLTNAHKHGDGRAVFDIRAADGEVVAEIRDGLAPSAAHEAPGGFGLIGMRERVRAAGGVLTVTVEDGIHVVRASFPVQADGEASC